MNRSLIVAATLACAAGSLLFPTLGGASDRTQPMQFALRQQGPTAACGAKCKLYISASGAITADTPNAFRAFAKNKKLAGATVVLDSDGGSVHGAIALGREIRRLGLDTTVGRLTDLKAGNGALRATLSPHADCESMCSFVLLAGVHRWVPAEARVMVHQIWLGDRREDPIAANYSAEDLVLVQRDLGKLAIYTAEMGGSMDMFDLALRIPPWEPMHVMTRDEIERMHVATEAPDKSPSATVATSQAPAPAAPQPSRLTNGVDITQISERSWGIVDRAGAAALARRHPLTLEGDEIGSFDLLVSCNGTSDTYDAVYIEQRHETREVPLVSELQDVSLQAVGVQSTLKVVSSRRSDSDDLISMATGTVPAALVDGFGAQGNHSMLVETKSGRVSTVIRIGNTGVADNLPRLANGCHAAVPQKSAEARPTAVAAK
jgi:hypothetical protein